MQRVLVTGVSGFIAGHITVELLKRGYSVRGTVRDLSKSDRIRAICEKQGLDQSKLDFVEANLDADSGWLDAMHGCDGVMHTASPFPMDEPRDQMALVAPAREGTLRVLKAAREAEIQKVVLTSSTVAVTNNRDEVPGYVFDDADWSNTSDDKIRAYALSKTLAEQAAWKDVEKHGGPRLSVINPSFVVGPLLDEQLSTSSNLIKQYFEGRFPAVPELCFGVVDVRDVACAHVNALERPEADGKRFIVAGGTRKMIDIAGALKTAFPERASKLPKFQSPKILVQIIALFQPSVRGLLPEVGKNYELDTILTREVLGLDLKTPEEALQAMGQSLIEHNLIRS